MKALSLALVFVFVFSKQWHLDCKTALLLIGAVLVMGLIRESDSK